MTSDRPSYHRRRCAIKDTENVENYEDSNGFTSTGPSLNVESAVSPTSHVASPMVGNIVVLPTGSQLENGMAATAFNCRAQTFFDIQRYSTAAKLMFPPNMSQTEQKAGSQICRKLFEWSNRAKSAEVARHVQYALKREDETYTSEELNECLANKSHLFFASLEASPTPSKHKRVRSVLELFCNELHYLYDRLLVLRNVFCQPLKHCQVEGCLLTIEPNSIFGNLDEICWTSFNHTQDFYHSLKSEINCGDVENFGSTDGICQVFTKFLFDSSAIAAYQTYCINYKTMIEYLENARKSDDRFVIYEKLCTADRRCKRLTLQDLLIAPLQHITRLPLLLREIHRHTADELERERLMTLVESVEHSLTAINESVRWLADFELLQELQSQLVWPSALHSDQKTTIPEYLRVALSRQFCESFLAHPQRKLIFEGVLTLHDSNKQTQMYAFLFNDMFMLTKCRGSGPRTIGSALQRENNRSSRNLEHRYTVHREPIPLDCCVLCDMGPEEASASGLRFAFIVLHLSRFCQVLNVYVLEVATRDAKKTWLAMFNESIDNFQSIKISDIVSSLSIFCGAGSSSSSTTEHRRSPRTSSVRPSPSPSQRGSIDFTSHAFDDMASPLLSAHRGHLGLHTAGGQQQHGRTNNTDNHSTINEAEYEERRASNSCDVPRVTVDPEYSICI